MSIHLRHTTEVWTGGFKCFIQLEQSMFKQNVPLFMFDVKVHSVRGCCTLCSFKGTDRHPSCASYTSTQNTNNTRSS